MDEIFEINFFANVNIIKAILPVMRERKNGHIIVITGISKWFTYVCISVNNTKGDMQLVILAHRDSECIAHRSGLLKVIVTYDRRHMLV